MITPILPTTKVLRLALSIIRIRIAMIQANPKWRTECDPSLSYLNLSGTWDAMGIRDAMKDAIDCSCWNTQRARDLLIQRWEDYGVNFGMQEDVLILKGIEEILTYPVQ